MSSGDVVLCRRVGRLRRHAAAQELDGRQRHGIYPPRQQLPHPAARRRRARRSRRRRRPGVPRGRRGWMPFGGRRALLRRHEHGVDVVPRPVRRAAGRVDAVSRRRVQLPPTGRSDGGAAGGRVRRRLRSLERRRRSTRRGRSRRRTTTSPAVAALRARPGDHRAARRPPQRQYDVIAGLSRGCGPRDRSARR